MSLTQQPTGTPTLPDSLDGLITADTQCKSLKQTKAGSTKACGSQSEKGLKQPKPRNEISMSKCNQITKDELSKYLEYDSEVGVFRWLVGNGARAKAGAIAGSAEVMGYWQIALNKVTYKAHRLAWLYVYGSLPKGVIDHINGDKRDNRIVNLRDVSVSGNQYNRKAPKNNTSGHQGVSFVNSMGRWRVTLAVGKKQINIGYYSKIDDAVAAHKAAKNKYHIIEELSLEK